MLHIEHGRNLHLVSVFMGEVVSKKTDWEVFADQNHVVRMA
jgi:hypothetical protein